MKLFPHALIRVAGGPFEILKGLEASESISIVTRIRACKVEREQARDQVCDRLYAAIQANDDEALLKKLLNIKRDVFNYRALSAGKIALLEAHLGDDPDLKAYLRLRQELEALETKGAALFEKELAETRRRMAQATALPALSLGLVLSSQTLLSSMRRYRDRAGSGKKPGKRELKTEISLIKYLSRICAKTSPFSTFTNLVMARLAEDGGAVISATATGEPAVVGHIRLNNALYRYLQDLLKCHPAYRASIAVRPNPTLKKADDHYLYLTNSNNVESFQRIPLNPVLDLFWDLAASAKEGLPFGHLVAQAGDAVEASEEDLTAYVSQLLDYGFLEYNLGISGIDTDWDLKLRERLAGWNAGIPFIGELAEMLRELRELAGAYAAADASGRIDCLNKAYERFKEVCLKLHESAGLPETERMTQEALRAHLKAEKEKAKGQEKDEEEKANEKTEEEVIFKHASQTRFSFKPEQMFYEDCALDVPFAMDRAELARITGAMDELYQKVELYYYDLDELDKMSHYFAAHFQGKTDLLTFYESYYRDFKKPERERVEADRKKKAEEKAAKEAEAAKADGGETASGEADGGAAETPAAPAQGEKAEAARGDDTAKAPAEAGAEEGGPAEVETAAVEAPRIPSIEARRETLHQIGIKAAEVMKDITPGPDGELHVGLPQIAAATADAPQPACFQRAQEQSYALFIQPYADEDGQGRRRARAVLNSTPYGYGKLFSRFLHIFDPQITAEVRAWNRRCDEQALLLEDCDASMFNANLHPPLMPYEIWMPGGQNSLPPENQIPITEIQIQPGEGGLELRHEPSGKQVFVFDLGFQGWRGRSELFLLLQRFSPTYVFQYMSLLDPITRPRLVDEKTEVDKPGVTYHPRIVFEDRLVLRRRTWTFPRQFLPEREPLATDWQYFRQVLDWKTAYDLPDEVFISITNFGEMDVPDGDKTRKLGRDDYKPQFLSFRNPILVRLFEKLVEKVPSTMMVVEMLPTSDQLVEMGGKHYVTEAIVQWSR